MSLALPCAPHFHSPFVSSTPGGLSFRFKSAIVLFLYAFHALAIRFPWSCSHTLYTPTDHVTHFPKHTLQRLGCVGYLPLGCIIVCSVVWPRSIMHGNQNKLCAISIRPVSRSSSNSVTPPPCLRRESVTNLSHLRCWLPFSPRMGLFTQSSPSCASSLTFLMGICCPFALRPACDPAVERLQDVHDASHPLVGIAFVALKFFCLTVQYWW